MGYEKEIEILKYIIKIYEKCSIIIFGLDIWHLKYLRSKLSLNSIMLIAVNNLDVKKGDGDRISTPLFMNDPHTALF